MCELSIDLSEQEQAQSSSKFAQIRRSDRYLRDIASRRANCRRVRPRHTPPYELLEEVEGFLHLVGNRSQLIVQRVADFENRGRR